MQSKHGLITLDEIINDYIDENQSSFNSFFRVWQIAYRGMANMGMQLFFEIKTVKLPVNANQTVNLPNDFQNYRKIGVLNGLGEIVDLHFNNQLTLFADNLPTRQSQTIDNTLYVYYQWQSGWFWNFWNGYGYQNLYGVPSGGIPAGYFNIDRTNNIIVLGEGYVNIFDYIMLEYIGTPQAENGQYYVPEIFREALVAWLNWKCLNPKLKGTGQWMALKKDFYNERRLALAAFKPFNIWNAYQWNATTTRLTVKT